MTNARTPNTFRRVWLRLAAGTVILLALGGPTPGYIGSCTLGAPAAVDAEQFCVDRRSYECARDQAAMRTTVAEATVCLNGVAAMCRGVSWSGCVPSAQLAAACISALRDDSRLGTTNDAIPECQQTTLCGGAPLVSPDELVTPDEDGI